MAPAKASGQKKAKSANGYRLPDPIPAGEIVTGLTKKKSWRVGKSIGKQEQFQELFQIAHLQWVWFVDGMVGKKMTRLENGLSIGDRASGFGLNGFGYLGGLL